uniref:Uncharacterized protein n=1 Tax=Arundo donax TaxID=35708 RepID=A0A0A8YLV4_ARUDO
MDLCQRGIVGLIDPSYME